METYQMLNIGFGNNVVTDRVIAIIQPNSAPVKRLLEQAGEERRLIDATQGRKTRAVIITDSNHVILSAIQTKTIANRLAETKMQDNS